MFPLDGDVLSALFPMVFLSLGHVEMIERKYDIRSRFW